MNRTKIEWIREIVGAADKAGIPVFLKDNLFNSNVLTRFHLFAGGRSLSGKSIQELPVAKTKSKP